MVRKIAYGVRTDLLPKFFPDLLSLLENVVILLVQLKRLPNEISTSFQVHSSGLKLIAPQTGFTDYYFYGSRR